MRFHHRRMLVPTSLIAALALVATIGGFAAPAAAQDGEESIIGVAWSCPDAAVDPGLTTCDTIAGVSIQVEVNGVEIAGSPFTTDLNSIGFNSIEFSAPADAEITLTQLGGVTDGYEPAPGSDPFTANVADLPIGGTGGESTAPFANLVNIPVSDAGDTDTDGTTTLPETGMGTSASPDARTATAVSLLVVSLLLGGAWVVVRTRQSTR